MLKNKLLSRHNYEMESLGFFFLLEIPVDSTFFINIKNKHKIYSPTTKK